MKEVLKKTVLLVLQFLVLACQPSERAVISNSDLDSYPNFEDEENEVLEILEGDESNDETEEENAEHVFSWCEPGWISNPMPIEDFLSQAICQEHADCQSGFYCLKK